MRASPAIDVMLTRFGVWRTAGALLAAAAVAAVWAWWSTWDTSPPHNVSFVLLAALVTVSGVIVALAASLARVPCTALRWDGQGWQMWRVRRDRAAVGERCRQRNDHAAHRHQGCEQGDAHVVRRRRVSGRP